MKLTFFFLFKYVVVKNIMMTSTVWCHCFDSGISSFTHDYFCTVIASVKLQKANNIITLLWKKFWLHRHLAEVSGTPRELQTTPWELLPKSTFSSRWNNSNWNYDRHITFIVEVASDFNSYIYFFSKNPFVILPDICCWCLEFMMKTISLVLLIYCLMVGCMEFGFWYIWT